MPKPPSVTPRTCSRKYLALLERTSVATPFAEGKNSEASDIPNVFADLDEDDPPPARRNAQADEKNSEGNDSPDVFSDSDKEAAARISYGPPLLSPPPPVQLIRLYRSWNALLSEPVVLSVARKRPYALLDIRDPAASKTDRKRLIEALIAIEKERSPSLTVVHADCFPKHPGDQADTAFLHLTYRLRKEIGDPPTEQEVEQDDPHFHYKQNAWRNLITRKLNRWIADARSKAIRDDGVLLVIHDRTDCLPATDQRLRHLMNARAWRRTRSGKVRVWLASRCDLGGSATAGRSHPETARL